MAEINPVAARYHNWTALGNPIADRRTDLYGEMLGYRPPVVESEAFRFTATT
jgi:hypothetical protein